jgi:hypothetical protein
MIIIATPTKPCWGSVPGGRGVIPGAVAGTSAEVRAGVAGKTRLIEFGRFAAERRKSGEGKPETFNFLGLTYICGRSRRNGYFTVYRKTMGKRMAAKLKDIRQKLRQRMHGRIQDTAVWLNSVARGYFQYHAVPDKEERMKAFPPRRRAALDTPASPAEGGGQQWPSLPPPVSALLWTPGSFFQQPQNVSRNASCTSRLP